MFKTALAYENWKTKYRYENETPEETFLRVAKALASVEKDPEYWTDKFYRTLVKLNSEGEAIGLKCTPGGRITANAGTDFKHATLLNCYISGAVSNAEIKYPRKTFDNKLAHDIVYKSDKNPDDLINIFLTILEQAKTLASEGGYGINFDFIRPRGSLIKGTGIKHPGVVSYMKIWDSVSECIVKGTNDGYIDKLKNYLNKEDFNDTKEIVKSMTRKGAMMGVLSCVSGDTLISTIDGLIPIKQLVGKNPLLYCTGKDRNIYVRRANKVWKTGKRKTLKILLDNDTHLICTPDHRIMLHDGSYKEAKDLVLGDSLSAFYKSIYCRKGIYKTSAYKQIGITGQKKTIPEHKAVCEFKYGMYPEIVVEEDGVSYSDNSQVIHHIDGNSLNNSPDNIELISFSEHADRHKEETIRIFDKNRKRIAKERKGKTWEEYYGPEKAAILKKRASERIKLKRKGSWNKGLNGAKYKEHYQNGFKNQFEEANTWEEAYGLEKALSAKNKKKETLAKNTLSNHKVISVSDYEEIDVFDISVPDFHNFVANGIFVHNCSHPDIEEFIRAKQSSGVLTKFNISVLIDDKFMEAVKKDKLYDLSFNGKIYKRVKAKDLYNIIMESTYNRAEPGVLFVDNMHRNNPLSYLGKATCCNPCGEVPGLGSLTTTCLLGSLNLTQYVLAYDKETGAKLKKPIFDWEQYEDDIKVFTRMLDNVNDITYNSLPSYDWVTKNIRQFGMGINGLGSALSMLRIPYNSNKSHQFVKKAVSIKENITWQTSALLAKEKGTFPAYDKEQFESTEYFNSDRIIDETREMLRKYGARNGKTTTNPPLGNTSVICDNVSNGIEPVFMLEYERKAICKDWPEGVNGENIKKLLKKYDENDYTYWRGDINGKTYYYEPHNRGLCGVTTVRDYGYQWLLDNYPEEDHSEYLVTTDKLTVDDHVNLQSIVQYYCNQSVSKTSNLPFGYPFDEFKDLYMKAWKKGLNGFTTYRSGSMESVISEISKAEESKEIIARDIKLPTEFVNGPTRVIKREQMKFYIHFSYLPEDSEMVFPVAMWIYTNDRNKDNSRICNKASRNLAKLALDCGVDREIVEKALDKAKKDYPHNRLGRMISLCMRHNVSRDDILVSLMGIDGDHISTLLTAVRKFIGETIKDGTKLKGYRCEECNGDNVILEGGCKKCQDCGFSGCG